MTDLCLKREFQTGQSRAGLQYRDIDANDLPGLHKIDGRGDLCRSLPQRRPVIRRQDDKSQRVKFC
jgi:hypothetical protein